MQHVLQTSKRVISAAIAAATIAFTVGAGALMGPVSASAASMPGDLIKGTSLSTVYYHGYDDMRYAFPNEATFFSWYSDFDGIMTLSDADLADITLGGNVNVRPGTHWIKITSDPKVYAVSTEGAIHWVESEEVAADLAGSDWADNVIDVPDVFFDDYSVGTSLMTALAYDGALYEMGGVVYLSWDGEMREVTDDGMDDNWFNADFVLDGANIDDSDLVLGDDVDMTLDVLTDASQTNDGVVVSVSDVTVSLASDSPASGTIVQGQATAGLANYKFSGSGNVTSVTLTRTGLSDQNTLTNVYLYDGATRLTDGYSFNSSGVITINGLDIEVDGSSTISVLADVGAAALAPTGQTVAVTLSSVTADGEVMATSLMGNTMTVGSGSALATVWLSANTVTASSVNAGTVAYPVWSAPVQINTREVWLKSANFRLTGSAPSDALGDITLFVDGVAKGSEGNVVYINGNNYASFDLTAAPVSLTTGSHTVEVRATIEKGSSFNVTASLSLAADMMLTDSQLGVNIALLGASGAAFSANTAGAITINSGSVTTNIDSVFQTMSNVSGGTTNATIGKFTMHAYGEDVKVNTLVVTPVFTGKATTYTSGTVTALGSITLTVASTTGFVVGNTISIAGATPAAALITAVPSATTLTVTITTVGATPAGAVTVTTGGLDNVSIYFNGLQVGSQQDWPIAGGNLSFTPGSQMIVPAGIDSTLEVRADIRTAAAVTYGGGTVAATLVLGSSNAEGQVSKTTVNVPTAASVGNTITVQSGLLAVSQNTGYASQTASPNTAGVKLGSFILQNQSSSESVRVTSLLVAMGGSEAITNISALRTSETSGAGATPIQPLASNTFSVDFTLAAGASKTIDILADTSSQTSVTAIATLTVTSIGVTSNISTTNTAVTGQTITLSNGVVATPSLVTASATQAQYIAAANGAIDATTATFNFISTGGAATIQELKFTIAGTASNPVTSVSVGGVSAAPVSGVAYLTGLALAVPNGGGGLTQDVKVSYAHVGTSGVTPNTTALITLSEVKYITGSSTTTLTYVADANRIPYTDADGTLTVTAGDTRRAVQVSVSSAYGQTNTGIATFVAAGDTLDEVKSFGTVTTGQTIILTETGAGTNIFGITGTLLSTGGYACTGRDAANGLGSATTSQPALLSILCTSGTTNQVVLNTLALGADAAAAITTITLTTTTLAIDTVVAAADSDLLNTLSAGGIIAPTMTVVGSKPTVAISSTVGAGLVINTSESKIGEVTISADAKGNIKVNDIVFTVGSSGYSTAPTSVTTTRIADGGTSTAAGSVCTPATLVVTCEFGTTANTDFDGYQITAGTSKTFNLYGILVGGSNTGAGVPTINTSVGTSTFNWDDASTNGASGTALTGSLLYNFPTASFSIK